MPHDAGVRVLWVRGGGDMGEAALVLIVGLFSRFLRVKMESTASQNSL